MRKLFTNIAAIFVLLPVTGTAQQAAAATARIVSAADAFLSSLDADQRKKALYAFDDNEQRARWSNFPTGVVPRGGIRFKQMTEPQRDAAMKLLSIVLSPMGLEKVNEIRQADDDFKANGSKRGPGGRGSVARWVHRREVRVDPLRSLVAPKALQEVLGDVDPTREVSCSEAVFTTSRS
jgi:hypothetical protein